MAIFNYELMAQPTDIKPMLPASSPSPFTISEIFQGQSEIESMPARTDIKRLRFEQNARCLGAYKDGELAGYIWLCFGHYAEDEVRCDFSLEPPEQSAFDFDFYIFPKYRFSRAFAALWDGTNRFLQQENIRFSFSRMTRFNLASRRAHRRMGALKIGSALFMKLWSAQIMIATVFPYFDISLSQSGRAKLQLKSIEPDHHSC